MQSVGTLAVVGMLAAITVRFWWSFGRVRHDDLGLVSQHGSPSTASHSRTSSTGKATFRSAAPHNPTDRLLQKECQMKGTVIAVAISLCAMSLAG
jgi:hypothetical protein